MATKKRTVKRTSSASARSRAKTKEMQSFRVEKDTIPFYHTKPTIQTFYWILLLAVIVIGQLWILKLQLDISNLTDALLAQ